MQRLVTLCMVLALCGCKPHPTHFTFNAATPELADVQTAIDQALEGDTVNIPAGTASWTSGLKIEKGITLHGETTTSGGGTATATADDQTIIVDETTNAINVLQFSTDKPYRVTGITFRGGPNKPGGSSHAILGLGNSTGRLNPAVRADHLHFDGPRQRAIWQDGWMYGVIDNVVMHMNQGQTQSFYFTQPQWNGETNGNGSFADFPYFGSEKFVFAEDCSILNTDPTKNGGNVDNMNGGRWVIRHCYFKDCSISGHGTESGPQRGNRADQWYDNIFDFTAANQANNGQRRSGNEIVHDNQWINLAPTNDNSTGSLGGLKAYRMIYRGNLWDMAQGTNGWDKNDPQLYDSGTVQAVETPAPGLAKDQRVLTIPGKNWTKDQWKKFSATNTTSTHPYLGIMINSNTADTLTIQTNYASDVPQDQWVEFHAGDSYEIHKVSQALDSAGTGKGDLIRMKNGVPINQVTGQEKSWLHWLQENTYTWNNAVLKTGQVLGQRGGECIVEGRDFFNLGAGLPVDTIPQQVKDFYTAANNGVAYEQEYTYPHPLRSSGGGGTGTPVPTGTPTASAEPTATASPYVTATPNPTPTETPTPAPTPVITPTVEPTATPAPTVAPTATATATAVPTATPLILILRPGDTITIVVPPNAR